MSPHCAQRHLHGVLPVVYGSSGSSPAERITATASASGTLDRAFRGHTEHPLPFVFTLVCRGVTTAPHFKHSHFHGALLEVYGSSGLSPAASMVATGSFFGGRGVRLFTAQNEHPPCPCFTLACRGVTIAPHFRHSHFHGTLLAGYGSSGRSPAACMTATASALFIDWRFAPRILCEHGRQPPLPPLTVL